MALARGAALAAAAAPRFEATTVGLAYSQDPDGATAADVYRANPSFVATQVRPVAESEPVIDDEVVADEVVADEGRRPFLLVGSTLSAIFVIGVVALVISLAVSIRPTADQRPNPGESVVVPSAEAPAPPVAEQVQPPPVAARRRRPRPSSHQCRWHRRRRSSRLLGKCSSTRRLRRPPHQLLNRPPHPLLNRPPHPLLYRPPRPIRAHSRQPPRRRSRHRTTYRRPRRPTRITRRTTRTGRGGGTTIGHRGSTTTRRSSSRGSSRGRGSSSSSGRRRRSSSR